jgi:hypothetical protein
VAGERAETQGGVSRAEAQMTVVVNEACGDDMLCGSGQMPRVRPGLSVLGEDWHPRGERSRSRHSTETLKRGMVVVRIQGGMNTFWYATSAGIDKTGRYCTQGGRTGHCRIPDER